MQVQLILLAIPSARAVDMQRIVGLCEEAGVDYQTLPKVQDIPDGTARSRDLRRVALDDLLGREPVSLNIDSISKGITGKSVLITGAGGSIGSELCRQVAQLNPKEMVLLEQNEFNLYTIALEIENTHPDLRVEARLGDVCDEPGVRAVFNDHSPQIVFHAAAYKHVSSLQLQIREAIRNNVIGTEVVSRVSDESDCEKFVLISTDKAVNPTSVMGASKRLAEVLIQARNAQSDVSFVIVRFGNVLRSAGSVVPLFEKQIRDGGPVTVTDSEVKRYLMTIPEACQLILQACVLGKGNEICVLNMGEQIKIDYLAKQLITLSGLVLGKDIKIIYTGLRPGEKLEEELFHSEEKLTETVHQQISLVECRMVRSDVVFSGVELLGVACREFNVGEIERIVKELVPEYLRGKGSTARVTGFSC